MNPPIVLAVVFVLGLALFAVLKSRWTRRPNLSGQVADYQLRAAVFTKTERALLSALAAAVPDGIEVMGKIRLADIFATKRGLPPARRQAAFQRLIQKRVSFLLVRTNDRAPMAGIELDDVGAEVEEKHARDPFFDLLFQTAGLPLLHVAAQPSYNPTELRGKVAALLARRPR